MTIWITGTSGFVGAAIESSLRQRGDEVADPKQLGAQLGLENCHRAYGVDELLALGASPEVVVHCAGNSNIKKSIEAPREDFIANYGLVQTWLEYLRRAAPRAKFIFLSTSAVYGSAVVASDERAPCSPVSPYGFNKLIAEQLISYYGRVHGIQSTILRLFSVYGPGQKKQIIWDALGRFTQGDFHFQGGGDNVRDFIHVDDIASLIPYAIAAADARAPIFNAGTGQGTTIRAAMDLLAELAGYPGQITFGSQRWPGDPRVLVGLNDAAQSLGWAPRIDLNSGLQATVAWFNELRTKQ